MTFRRARSKGLTRWRLALSGAAIAALGASTLVATAPAADAAISVDTSAWYVIVNVNSGKALDLYNWSTSDGAEFRQWTRTDGTNQQFQLVSSGSGYYRLKNRYSGKVVDVWGWSTADGGEINQYTDLNGANQQWSLTGSNNDSVRFINRNSGKAMEVYNWSTSDGGDIAQWTDYGNANQTWKLIAVGSGGSTTTTTTTTTTSSSGGGTTSTFTNPIKANGADPAMQYYNGYYYLSTTTWSTYMSMRRSRTLAGLATASEQTIWNADNSNRGYNMWAPDFQRLTGPNGTRWYYMFSAGHQADLNLQHLVVLESSGDDPMGPYHFAGEPLGTSWGIDGNYLTYNGNLYLLYSAWSGAYQNIYVRRMTNPWTVTGSATLVTSPTLSWEQVGGNTDEGPAVLQHGGRTFVAFSASSCNTPDYKLGMLELVGDPLVASNWKKWSSPVFSRSDANGVYGPGHNYFFSSPDGTETWQAYHANASSSQGCGSTRSTRVQKVTWNSDGTPNLGTPVRTGTAITAPSGE